MDPMGYCWGVSWCFVIQWSPKQQSSIRTVWERRWAVLIVMNIHDRAFGMSCFHYSKRPEKDRNKVGVVPTQPVGFLQYVLFSRWWKDEILRSFWTLLVNDDHFRFSLARLAGKSHITNTSTNPWTPRTHGKGPAFKTTPNYGWNHYHP